MAKDLVFLKGGNFIMNAENMADALKNTSLSQDELFIREAFQNIFDEHKDKTKKLEIKISIKELYGPEKQSFVDALQYNEIKNKSPLFHDPNNWFKKGHEELKKINNPSEKLRILEISDHNANGLGGLWNRVETNEDKFHNLVLSITKSKKQGESSTNALGSYGYGKMVFAMNSDIRSIIYYSHFPETPRTGADRRLMATSFLPTFYNKNDDIEYTGHAFFGEDSGKSRKSKRSP